MKLSSAASACARAAFSGLIDYAGLFPPARLSMDDAVGEYASLQGLPEAWILGRFVVAQSAFADFDRALGRHGTGEVACSAIVGGGATARTFVDAVSAGIAQAMSLAQARVESFEVPLPTLDAARDSYDASIAQLAAALSLRGVRELPTYAELPRDARFDAELERAATALARAKVGAKLRCGGVTADAFPSSAQVAAFIDAMCAAGVPFKCTAGLHHPIRHVDPATGFHMHGFVNVLVASALAGDVSRDELERVLDEEDPAAFAIGEAALRWRERSVDTAGVERTRRKRFVAYGSCSFTEPVEVLRSLGVLA